MRKCPVPDGQAGAWRFQPQRGDTNPSAARNALSLSLPGNSQRAEPVFLWPCKQLRKFPAAILPSDKVAAPATFLGLPQNPRARCRRPGHVVEEVHVGESPAPRASDAPRVPAGGNRGHGGAQLAVTRGRSCGKTAAACCSRGASPTHEAKRRAVELAQSTVGVNETVDELGVAPNKGKTGARMIGDAEWVTRRLSSRGKVCIAQAAMTHARIQPPFEVGGNGCFRS